MGEETEILFANDSSGRRRKNGHLYQRKVINISFAHNLVKHMFLPEFLMKGSVLVTSVTATAKSLQSCPTV